MIEKAAQGHSIHAALRCCQSVADDLSVVEYLVLKMNSYYHFEKEAPRPVCGRIVLPEGPGSESGGTRQKSKSSLQCRRFRYLRFRALELPYQ